MATIARTTKAGSSTVDFASATTALSSEVNTDFNTLYDDYNGNVNSSNIATDGVATANITDLNVTTGKLAANAVTTAKITDANVTLAKLAVGAVVNNVASDTDASGATVTSESTIMTLGSITLSGTSVYLFAGVHARAATLTSGTTNFIVRLKEDAATIFTVTRSFGISPGSGLTLPVSATIIHNRTATAAGHIYTVTVERTGAANVTILDATNFLLAVELK